MLTSTSLQAFSGATTSTPIGRTTATDATSGIRLVRNQPDSPVRQAAPIPGTAPAIPPPRGSLLNLSV